VNIWAFAIVLAVALACLEIGYVAGMRKGRGIGFGRGQRFGAEQEAIRRIVEEYGEGDK